MPLSFAGSVYLGDDRSGILCFRHQLDCFLHGGDDVDAGLCGVGVGVGVGPRRGAWGSGEVVRGGGEQDEGVGCVLLAEGVGCSVGGLEKSGGGGGC